MEKNSKAFCVFFVIWDGDSIFCVFFVIWDGDSIPKIGTKMGKKGLKSLFWQSESLAK